MPRRNVDPRILALCKKVTAKRPRTVINHIIKHGSVTTEELRDLYGYDHPPRAARDVRDWGIPLVTETVISRKTGRRIGSYRFGDPAKIVRGRSGRRAFSKHDKDFLVDHYDSRDAITGEQYQPRYLQIDHRVPYGIAGDGPLVENSPDAYMLLTASSQRAKSWSCEHCPNLLQGRDAAMCGSCFWASPESYSHIAGEEIRRADIEWRGAEIETFERIRDKAKKADTTVTAVIKKLLARALG